MRTRNYFKYLLAALALLCNVSFVVAQQQTEITFDYQGGWYEHWEVPMKATYGLDMPLEAHPDAYNTVALVIPKSNKGTFGGYYDQPDGQGTQYYKNVNGTIQSAHIWDKIVDKAILYAYWGSGNPKPANTYTVTLDRQGGTGGTTSVTATLNSTMPSATAPTVSSWKFDGYYTEKYGVGEMYYTPEMTSARNWDISSDATLYACWKYRVALHRNDGTGSVDYVYTNKDKAWPNAPIPTRTGYIFEGYYTRDTKLQCYDSEMRSVTPWRSGGSGNIDAYWTAKTYNATIHYLSNDSRNIESTQTISAEINGTGTLQPSSEVCSREGYTLLGWSTTSNGNVVYHNNDSFSPRNDATDESKGDVYLYAIWQEQGSSEPTNTYIVTLNSQNGTGGTTSITATLNSPMPSATAPTRTGYTFGGYFTEQNGAGTQYYNADMTSANNWNLSANTTLYAKWTEENSEQGTTYTITLNAGSHSVIPKTIGAGNCEILQSTNGIIKISVSYGQKVGYIFNGKPKNAGFDLIGFYDDNDVLVATVDLNDPDNRDIHFTNKNNTYFRSQDGEWNYPNNLTLNAKYLPKYTLEDDNIIKFGSETHTVVLEVEEDWAKFTVNDLVGAVRAETESGRISTQNPVMVFDLRNTKYINGASSDAKSFLDKLWQNDYKDYISPNVLVYLNAASGINQRTGNPREDTRNAILYDGTCPNLYITDRIPMKIPYGIKAINATYERNRVQSEINDMEDAMWKQSYESVWGTLCLPYPIKNNNSHKVSNEWNAAIDCEIKFYELRGTHDNYMQFYEMEENATIPANTPVLYCRTKGVGSAVSITERSNKDNIAWATPEIQVPANGKYVDNKYVYETTPIEYGNKTQVPLANSSVDNWRFVGTLEEKTLMGSDYKELYAKSPGVEVVADGRDIYYFASNKFTHMNPKSGKVLVYPYRAYFEDCSDQIAGSKVSSYSILVVDADGTTTDITNLIDNHEAKGNGKIYDLSGRRVKQPVKGSIYIVDGKKKMY